MKHESSSILWKFWLFSVVVSVNHALSYVVTAFATSLLPESLASLCLALTWILNAIAGLFVANPLLQILGSRRAMILSVAGYAIQMLAIVLAISIQPDDHHHNKVASSWSAAYAIIGCTIAGITSAVWWTAQGVYFEAACFDLTSARLREQRENSQLSPLIESVSHKSARKLSQGDRLSDSDDDAQDAALRARATLSAHWTVTYQLADVIVFGIMSFLPATGLLTLRNVLVLLTVVGGFTLGLSFFFSNPPLDRGATDHALLTMDDLVMTDSSPLEINDMDNSPLLTADDVFSFADHQESVDKFNKTHRLRYMHTPSFSVDTSPTISESKNTFWDSVLDVPRQCIQDARVLLLAPFSFAFGVTTAAFAVYVNSSLISDSSDLGTDALGALEAMSYLVAVAAAFPFAMLSECGNGVGEDWVMQLGSVCFMLTGLVLLSGPPSSLRGWFPMIAAKFVYGLGRGVFEGVCRAVYARVFTGRDLSTAFSGQTLAVGFSGGIAFFIFPYLSATAIGVVVLSVGFIAMGAYALFMRLPPGVAPVKFSELFSNSQVTVE